MRLSVRVRPGASRQQVSGTYDAPDGPQLCVAVTARAVDGKATDAVLRAVAEAFDVRRSSVTLVTGATSRTKVLSVDAPGREAELQERLATLLVGQRKGRSR
ncbi:hypothetical protein KEM60_02302 [Austwickia sp. TVS 96-490-7B]|uniref:DUF167 domain-containing protein n=1 Tax=Austwickia sp. TVS 96-490-7B TaxID=2830843 RepID=UPI001C56574E|nr:DUF167 domain-containing protein [Austwickia sp. TVS 96-490-7B]MBW3086091.1 hypothetical protein [Austwickia sp. TVS 96-490-7B]